MDTKTRTYESSLFYIIDLIIATTTDRNISFYNRKHSLCYFGGFFFPCLPPWEPCRPCSYLVTSSCSCFPLVSCTYHPVRARLFLFGLYVALNLSLLKGFSPRKLGTKGIYETNVGKGVILLYLGPWK